MTKTRTETDSLGSIEVPLNAYYGVQTARALDNFTVTGIPISHYPEQIRAIACIKQACAEANMELELLDTEIGQAIVAACREVRAGEYDDSFGVDVIQGGAGTSVNMNANEVIANRALEILGFAKGNYERCHPNNHVNLSQSTNDVYPTTLRIGAVWCGQDFMVKLGRLRDAFLAKGEEFAEVIKMGRTQLQDAVPMTLGQEFRAFGVTVGEDADRIGDSLKLLCEINMGATAIGTGINTVPEYAAKVCQRLQEITGLPLITSTDLVEATSDTGAFVQLSGVLKRVAVKLSKICNDLRLLSSGPMTGLREINLPPMQPGSSIMPGKVNPVIPEMVNQVCYQVIGNDLTVTLAAESGQLQLNVFEPIIAFNIFQSMDMLSRSVDIFIEKCLMGITANPERCLAMVKSSMGLATALAPFLGYDEAARIAKKARDTDKSVYDLVLEEGLMTEAEMADLLDPKKMTCPRAMTRKK
ncbi:MAG: aspartate ammonia-lyase [Proteobacteria bacterium]|nr:aspartate ammonia-lyase [Pseudomonadota bacterium]MBU1612375.1 aspartate ammonia-lyase [Pseudomonadota bacterium]